jgi:hypothetical protein
MTMRLACLLWKSLRRNPDSSEYPSLPRNAFPLRLRLHSARAGNRSLRFWVILPLLCSVGLPK